MLTIAQIDRALSLNWSLIRDGPRSAVDEKAVRKNIDQLLEERFALMPAPHHLEEPRDVTG